MSKLCGAFSATADIPLLHRKTTVMLAKCGVGQPAADAVRARHRSVVAAGGTDMTMSSPFCEASLRASVALAGRYCDEAGLAERHKISLPASAGGVVNAADLLAALLAAAGPRILRELNGVFSFIHQDLSSGRVLIANDRYGLHPLYYYNDRDLLLVASECKAICAVQGGLSPDWGGYGDFFYLGHLLGSRTLFEEVKGLGPGEYLEWSGGRAARHRYWSLSDITVRKAGEVSAEEAHRLFSGAVERRLDRRSGDTLLLSAGFDSRLILGAMLEAGYRPRLFSVAYAQERGLAERLVRALDLQGEVQPERRGPTRFRESFEAFYLGDGMKTTFHLNPIPCSDVYPRLPEHPGRVWEGTPIGTALGGSGQSEERLERSMQRHLIRQGMHRAILKQLLQPEVFQRIEDEFRWGVNEEMGGLSEDAEGWLKFLLKNRIRRRIGINPHQILNRTAVAVSPGCDHLLLDFLLSVPFSAKNHYGLYRVIFSKYDPRLLSVPIVSGGKYLDLSAGACPRKKRKAWMGQAAGLVRSLGLSPLVKGVMARSGYSEYARPDFMCRVVGMKGLNRSIYRRGYLERALRKVEGGSRIWLTALSVPFQIELWDLMFAEDRHDALARELRTIADGSPAQPAPG